MAALAVISGFHSLPGQPRDGSIRGRGLGRVVGLLLFTGSNMCVVQCGPMWSCWVQCSTDRRAGVCVWQQRQFDVRLD